MFVDNIKEMTLMSAGKNKMVKGWLPERQFDKRRQVDDARKSCPTINGLR